MKLYLTVFAFIFSLFVASSIVFAQSSIGVVIAVTNNAAAVGKDNSKRILKRGTDIYLHDKIITQKNSSAKLRLKDNSIIIVQSLSEFHVSEFSFSRSAPRKNKYVGNLAKGALINISGQGNPKNYKLNSPLTTIAFRGTSLATKLIRNNNKLVNQEIYVFDGYVNVGNRCTSLACRPQNMDIGVGQKVNSATVNMVGKITGYMSDGFIMDAGCGDVVNKGITKGGAGNISIKCKGKR